jgi:hypothetical protein
VDFSEARVLFGIIFQILEPNCKIMDCGLILKKPRGLSAKCRKLEFPGIVPKGKPVDQVHEFMDRGRLRSTMDHGHHLGGGSPENGRNGAPVCGTLPWLRKKGEGTAVSLIGYKRGWRWVGHSRATVGNNQRRRRSVG